VSDHGVPAELADALQVADAEGVGAQQFARSLALHAALAKAGIELFQEGGLFRSERDRPLGSAPLQRQPAVVAAAETVEDLLHGDRRDPLARQRQQRRDPRDDLGRRRLRTAAVDRRRVPQTGEVVRLEPSFPLVEAGPVHPPLPTRLRRIAQLRRQLQHTHALPRQLRRRIP
jgi:hypothetical protein